jgi:hypothetical protein
MPVMVHVDAAGFLGCGQWYQLLRGQRGGANACEFK